MDTLICACDLDFICEAHTEANDAMTWPAVLGIKPSPFDARDAYDDSYRSKFWEGWD